MEDQIKSIIENLDKIKLEVYQLPYREVRIELAKLLASKTPLKEKDRIKLHLLMIRYNNQ